MTHQLIEIYVDESSTHQHINMFANISTCKHINMFAGKSSLMNVLTGKALNYGRIEGSLKVNGLEDDLRCVCVCVCVCMCMCVCVCVCVPPLPPTTHNLFSPPLPPLPFSCLLLSSKIAHRNTQPSILTLNPYSSTPNAKQQLHEQHGLCSARGRHARGTHCLRELVLCRPATPPSSSRRHVDEGVFVLHPLNLNPKPKP
jgi:hypothetical protein